MATPGTDATAWRDGAGAPAGPRVLEPGHCVAVPFCARHDRPLHRPARTSAPALTRRAAAHAPADPAAGLMGRVFDGFGASAPFLVLASALDRLLTAERVAVGS
jgi:hypothetical protein